MLWIFKEGNFFLAHPVEKVEATEWGKRNMHYSPNNQTTQPVGRIYGATMGTYGLNENWVQA